MWSRRRTLRAVVLPLVLISLSTASMSCKKAISELPISKELGYTPVNPPKRANVVGTIFMIQHHTVVPVLFGSDCLSTLTYDTTGVALGNLTSSRTMTIAGSVAVGSEDPNDAPAT